MFLVVCIAGLSTTACRKRITQSPLGKVAPTPLPISYSLVTTLPSYGNGIAIDLDDNVYVVENVIDPAGSPNSSGGAAPILDIKVVKYTANWNRVFSFGSLKARSSTDEALGAFKGLKDVAVDYCGNIYTLEDGYLDPGWNNSRIQMFDSEGAYVKHYWLDPTDTTAITTTSLASVPVWTVFWGAQTLDVTSDMIVAVMSVLPPWISLFDFSKNSPEFLDAQSPGVLLGNHASFTFIPDQPANATSSAGGFYTVSVASHIVNRFTLDFNHYFGALNPVPAFLGSATNANGIAIFGKQKGSEPSCNGDANFDYEISHYAVAEWQNPVGIDLYENTGFTVDASMDKISSLDHGFAGGEEIYLDNSGGALPAGLAPATKYYVLYDSSGTFKVSLTSNGPPVDITLPGTGDHFYTYHINTLGKTGVGRGEFNKPIAPKFDSRGFLYVPDPLNYLVHVYRPLGQF